MAGYLTKNYGLHYDNIPGKYQDLKHDERYKDLPVEKKFLLAEGIVAREMSTGSVSKQTSAPNTLTYLLDSVPFDDVGKDPNKEKDLSAEFNQAVKEPKKDKPKPKEGSIYYEKEETKDVIPEEQLTEFGQFMLYSKKNNLVGIPVEKQIALFDQSIYKKKEPEAKAPEPETKKVIESIAPEPEIQGNSNPIAAS